jgi:hypothetical protein
MLQSEGGAWINCTVLDRLPKVSRCGTAMMSPDLPRGPFVFGTAQAVPGRRQPGCCGFGDGGDGAPHRGG